MIGRDSILRIMGPLIATGIVALCFWPMFHLNQKRLKAIGQIKAGGINSVDLVTRWRDAVKKRIQLADGGAYCFIGLWLCPLLGSAIGGAVVWLFLIGSIVCWVMASLKMKEANKLAKSLSLPVGLKWLTNTAKGLS